MQPPLLQQRLPFRHRARVCVREVCRDDRGSPRPHVGLHHVTVPLRGVTPQPAVLARCPDTVERGLLEQVAGQVVDRYS